MELLGDKWPIEEFIHSLKHGGGITTTTTKSGPVRDPLHQRDGDAMGDTRLFAEGIRSFHTEIIWPRGEIRIIAGQEDPMIRRMGDLNLVGKGKRHHECFQIMESVRAFSQDPERKVDLGRSRE